MAPIPPLSGLTRIPLFYRMEELRAEDKDSEDLELRNLHNRPGLFLLGSRKGSGNTREILWR